MQPERPALPDLDAVGEHMMHRLDALAAITEQPERLTRRVATPEHRRALDLIGGWMREAGMSARIDDVGNLVGRYEANRPDAPSLLMGSHQDTVIDAGRYDGMLGIVAGLACVGHLHAAGTRLPFAIEIVAFCDEEGVRYGTTLLGSRALAGTFDMSVLEREDADGITLRQALQEFGCRPDAIPELARDPARLVGFLETHIEQGPVLEREGLPLGVVDGFAGCSRVAVEIRGTSGHAGTVPMTERRDAGAAAAEAVLAVEQITGRYGDRAVATVGRLTLAPGAINVIPGHSNFTIDVRSPDDATRETLFEEVLTRFDEIAARRHVTIDATKVYEARACRCDRAMRARLEAAVRAEGITPRTLFSGAGHDAMAMTAVAPTAMLFVRCAGGISHHPAEAITGQDAALAVRVLFRTLIALAAD